VGGCGKRNTDVEKQRGRQSHGIFQKFWNWKMASGRLTAQRREPRIFGAESGEQG
jgi:hypothetical protein